MSSEPIRDQIADHLLSPMNSALIMVDYQPTQVISIRSMDQQQLVQNSVRVARLATTYGLPIILSTVT
jgi:nicotinamidase-related amidase